MDILVNGINLYYEKLGTGKPLILVHGNGETHEIFDKIVPLLQSDFTVYAIDSRSHGKSDKAKELNYIDMADDILQFCDKLCLENPAFYGFSDGGIVGLLAEIKRPGVFSHLMVSGANTKPSGIKKRYLIPIKIMYFFKKAAELKLMVTQPNITAQMLSAIKAKTLVLAGEKDMISQAETKFIASSIKGSTLKILPKETHTSYVVNSEKLYPYIIDFLLV